MFKSIKHLFILGIMATVLSSCGGSGDSGGATPGPAGKSLRITITPVANSIPSNTNNFPPTPDSPFYTQVNVRVTFDNGTPIPDGTEVHLRTSNVQIAPISTLDDPETTDVDEFSSMFGTIFNEATGGNATFFVHGGELSGTATLTASAVNPETSQTSFSEINYTVTPGPAPFDRLTIEAQRTNLPANVFGLSPREAWGTVYMTEATISFRDPLGNFVNPASDGDSSSVGVAVSNTNVITFSTLDDPETEPDDDPNTEENEIFILLGQGPVDMVAGRGTIFIWSSQPGVGTITVSVLDQFTGEDISTTLDINVATSGNGMPTSISSVGGNPSYINGSGGNQAQSIQVHLRDADGLPAMNPNGVNNIIVDMVTDGNNSGEFLSGTNAQGIFQQGQSIKLASADGLSVFALNSGSSSNTAVVTVTSDRADNNVDNGLQDPIFSENSFVISDGVLFGLDITIADLQNFFVNGVTNIDLNAGTGQLDGTYTLGISVIGTDKGGNPALPTTVQFGLIDSPLDGFPNDGPGVFAISGSDGDPQEGGNQFTSASANFFTEANGVQPGDTLLIWGEDIQGNEDLESAVSVNFVNSQTRLTINEHFNRNDLTGSIINDMGIFPYAVGRALDGNIEATATLGDNGVATTYLNFPVSKLGKLAAIYAKGVGGSSNGVTRFVTDVETLIYPGLSSFGDLTARLVASPNLIPANSDSLVYVCLYDAAGHPLQGRQVSWGYSGEGTGSIDGQVGSGVMDNATGSDGCAVGVANASGIVTGGGDNGFNFAAGGLTCDNGNNSVCIEVAEPGATILMANPSAFFGSGGKEIVLTLVDGGGNGISGASITGECTSTGGVLEITSQPTITDADGNSDTSVFAYLDEINDFYTGECTFTAGGTGGPQATVTFTGEDECQRISPAPPAICTP